MIIVNKWYNDSVCFEFKLRFSYSFVSWAIQLRLIKWEYISFTYKIRVCERGSSSLNLHVSGNKYFAIQILTAAIWSWTLPHDIGLVKVKRQLRYLRICSDYCLYWASIKSTTIYSNTAKLNLHHFGFSPSLEKCIM